MKSAFKTLLSVFAIAFQPALQAQDVSGPDEARQIAKDAYVYGFPIVENYRVQYARGDSWNVITDVPLRSNDETPYPKLDTLNACVPVDLRAEPMLIEILPHNDDRYYTIQFTDLYTHNFAHLGSRLSNTNLGVFLLAGPNWKPFKDWKPVGVYEIIRCETDLAFLFYRTVMRGPGDFRAADLVRQDFRIYPLSQYNGQSPAESAPPIPFMAPLSKDDERKSTDFFKELNFLLQFCPTIPSESALMARFAKIGIGPGLTFEPGYFDPAIRLAIARGMGDAWRSYDAAKKELDSGTISFTSLFGSRGELGNNYLHRMLGAGEGLNTDSRVELIEERYAIDANGEKLDAKKGRYRLHFRPDQIPPVSGMWSVTLYELPSRQFFQNPIGRYTVNSTMLPGLTRDADGGLTFIIQNESPQDDATSNWFPAPKGPFIVALRLYGPRPEAVAGSWRRPMLDKL